MSRSCKKHPVCTAPNRQKRYWKQIANRRIRRRKDVLNHRSYRKAFRSWMITEYRCHRALSAWRQLWTNSTCVHERYPVRETWEHARLTWRKIYKFK